MAAVVCDVPAAGSVDIRLRTSMDAGSWGPWFTAPLEVVDENGAPQAFIDPIWTGAGRYVQVQADRTPHADPSPSQACGSSPSTPPEKPAWSRASRVPSGASRPRWPASRSRTPPPRRPPTPAIVTRAEWGADETLRSGSPSYAPVKVAFVHHTASGNVYAQADAPGIVRAIYAYHTKTLHWSDIGYNFLIDRYGTIYEGRYGGIARGVIGAQAGGFNTGSTGISVLGTFIDQAPPAETVAALERLLAWKLGVAGLDPTGTSTLTCGLTDRYVNGAKVTFPVIAGHRQANYTECPGDAFYALLPAIRANVAKRVGASLNAALSASDPLISPNGDGVLDATQFDIGITAAAGWRLIVRDAGGETVASWSGEGSGSISVGRRLRRPRRLRRRVHRRGHGHRRGRRHGHRLGSGHCRHGGAAALRRLGRAGVVQPQRGWTTGERHRHVHARRDVQRPRRSPGQGWQGPTVASRLADTRRARLHGHVGRPYRFRRRPDGRAGRILPFRCRAPRRSRQHRPPGDQGHPRPDARGPEGRPGDVLPQRRRRPRRHHHRIQTRTQGHGRRQHPGRRRPSSAR